MALDPIKIIPTQVSISIMLYEIINNNSLLGVIVVVVASVHPRNKKKKAEFEDNDEN